MAIAQIFRAFGLAVGQVGDPSFRRVLLLGVGLALLLLVGASAGFVWLIDWLTGEDNWLPVRARFRGLTICSAGGRRCC